MCVIALIPREKPVSQEDLQKCWNRNPDGAGYMFAHGGKITVRKFMAWAAFIEQFQRDHAVLGPVADFVLHFRIATSGLIDLANAHPFKAGPDHAFVHNGVLGQGQGDKSDTHLFRDRIAEPLFRKFPQALELETLTELIKGYIGTYNKMVFLRKDGLYRIVNESAGTWKDGLWFSNTSWSYEYKGSYSAPANTVPYGPWREWDKGSKKKDKGEKNNCHVKEREKQFKKCAWCPTLTSADHGLCFRCYKEELNDPFHASDKLPGPDIGA